MKILLVRTRSDARVSKARAKAKFNALGVAEARREIPHIRVKRLEVADEQFEAVKNSLLADPDVEFVEEQGECYPTAVYGSGSQWYWDKVRIPQALSLPLQPTVPIIVAVLDSGFDVLHPDLKDVFLPGRNVANDNFDLTEVESHGTSVAALAAGHVYGEPLQQLYKILPIRIANGVLPNGGAAAADMAEGIIYVTDYAVTAGAKLLINISYASSMFSQTVQDAVNYAWDRGAILFAGAGNSNNGTTMYPASYNNVVSVSAISADDTRSSFSSFGAAVDICAPGGTGTVLEQFSETSQHALWTAANRSLEAGGYTGFGGTSGATPIVTRSMAQCVGINPSLTNTQLVDLLLTQGVVDIGVVGRDIYFGYGKLDAFKAATAAFRSLPGNGDALAAYSAIANVLLSPKTTGITYTGQSVTVKFSTLSLDPETTVTAKLDDVIVASSTQAQGEFNLTGISLGKHTLEIVVATATKLASKVHEFTAIAPAPQQTTYIELFGAGRAGVTGTGVTGFLGLNWVASNPGYQISAFDGVDLGTEGVDSLTTTIQTESPGIFSFTFYHPGYWTDGSSIFRAKLNGVEVYSSTSLAISPVTINDIAYPAGQNTFSFEVEDSSGYSDVRLVNALWEPETLSVIADCTRALGIGSAAPLSAQTTTYVVGSINPAVANGTANPLVAASHSAGCIHTALGIGESIPLEAEVIRYVAAEVMSANAFGRASPLIACVTQGETPPPLALFLTLKGSNGASYPMYVRGSKVGLKTR